MFKGQPYSCLNKKIEKKIEIFSSSQLQSLQDLEEVVPTPEDRIDSIGFR